MKYRVMVDDNFHYMDESERYEAGVFDTPEAALQAARDIVDASLRHLYPQIRSDVAKTPERLFSDYKDFGEDPFIRPRDDSVEFSAWDYAKSRCADICAEMEFREKEVTK